MMFFVFVVGVSVSLTFITLIAEQYELRAYQKGKELLDLYEKHRKEL